MDVVPVGDRRDPPELSRSSDGCGRVVPIHADLPVLEVVARMPGIRDAVVPPLVRRSTRRIGGVRIRHVVEEHLVQLPLRMLAALTQDRLRLR